MRIKIISLQILLLACFLFFNKAGAQETEKPFFSSGDRVCFVGNSITHIGHFHHNILLYYTTRFPGQPVTFYNCGIGGDVAKSVLNRMNDDILVHQPTHAIVMLGMNDVKRWLYGPGETTNADTLAMRQKAISAYMENLEEVITIFLSKNIRVILEKPTIYDQTVQLETANNLGVNDALKDCADYVGVLAKKYHLLTVDYFTIMSQLNKKIQMEDPSATLIGNDRVHPGAVGHLVMSYQFLKSVQSPKYVSKIVVAINNDKITTKGSLGCKTELVSIHPDEVTFKVTEDALPFPIVSNQEKGLELVPFTNDLNVELLRVSGLKKGVYTLSIDGIEIASFSNDEYDKGINLSEYHETPQYVQALKVREILESLWQEEENLRGIKFIESNPFFKECPDKTNLEVVHSYLDSVFSARYTNQYYKRQLAKYVETKPSENKYEIRSDRYRDEAYRMAQPMEHEYRIVVKD